MKRFLIRLGDKTTAGGVVIHGEDGATNDGTPLAYHGAQIYCPVCKTTGFLCNNGPHTPMTFDGKRQIGLEGDLCICKCNPPPRLIASRQDMSMSFTADELAAMGYKPNGAPMVFDEQFVLVHHRTGRPLEGVRYWITKASGKVTSGVTDTQGRTQRITTDRAERLSLEIEHG